MVAHNRNKVHSSAGYLRSAKGKGKDQDPLKGGSGDQNRHQSDWSEWEFSEDCGQYVRHRELANGAIQCEFKEEPTEAREENYRTYDESMAVWDEEGPINEDLSVSSLSRLESTVSPSAYSTLQNPVPFPEDQELDRDRTVNVFSASEYVVIGKPHRFFKVGRVFATPWPQGNTQIRDLTQSPITTSTILIFVVLREENGFSVCCPLVNQTEVPGWDSWPQGFAFVYLAGKTPQTMPNEVLSHMGSFPIVIENTSFKFDDSLLLDFSVAQPIQHGVRALNIGRVDRKFLKALTARLLQVTGVDTQSISDSGKYALSYDAYPEPKYGRSEIQTEPEIPRWTNDNGFGDSRPVSVSVYNYTASQPPSDVDRLEIENLEISQKEQSPQQRDAEVLTNLPKKIDLRDTNSAADQHSLSSNYRKHNATSYKRGKVFKILWTEPLGDSHQDSNMENDEYTETSATKYGEKAYSSIRRFAIVKALYGHCLSVPILTYNGRGTAKTGVKREHHAIFYTGSKPPKELPGERKLRNKPIRMLENKKEDVLSPSSRVNYAKIYTIEYNVKVCFIGKVHKDSEKIFLAGFKKAYDEETESDGGTMSSDINHENE